MLVVERTEIYGPTNVYENPHIEQPMKGETRHLYIWYSKRLNTCNLYEYMLQCDISNETYTQNILQFNAEKLPGPCRQHFKALIRIKRRDNEGNF